MDDEQILRTTSDLLRRRWPALLVLLVVVVVLAFFGAQRFLFDGSGKVRLIVYAFSTQEPVLTQGILPAFKDRWESEGGRVLAMESVFGPSATLASQINHGAPADVTLFSNAHHVSWLQMGRRLWADSKPTVVGCTPIVIVTRPGNPAGIESYADLARPGLRLLHADPESSGLGEWAVLAVYGSALPADAGGVLTDPGAIEQLEAVWRNVRLVAPSARALMTLFELGAGDAFISYEQDALLALERGVELEIVMPPRTIAACHVAKLVDGNLTRAERPVAEALVDFMLSDAGQEILRAYHLRPPELVHPGFAPLGEIFTPDDLGGWAQAHRRLVQDLWQKRIEPWLELEGGPVLVGMGGP
jgi:sulfate/thiosulfate transport system substrate-binding protein